MRAPAEDLAQEEEGLESDLVAGEANGHTSTVVVFGDHFVPAEEQLVASHYFFHLFQEREERLI